MILCMCFLLSSSFLSCASTPVPQGGTVKIPDDFFGMVHAGGTESAEEYELLDEMGVTWILRTLNWDRIENQRGILDYSVYDRYVDAAKQNDKKVLAVLGFETPWLFRNGKSKHYIPPEYIPQFLQFVEETVLHFKGRVDVWEVWNEPNLRRFWHGPRKEFYELSRLAAIKIRETDPDAYILGGVFWRSPGGFIKGMHKAGALENLDGLAFHPYAVNPAGAAKTHDKFLKTLAGINYSGPVWITEIGYPTGGLYPSKVSLEKLPSYVVKSITGAAARGAKNLLWYQLFDRHNEHEVPPDAWWDSERFFGLVYNDYQRKDGAWAYELCARYLPGSRYIPELPLRENIADSIVSFCFLDGIAGSNTLILWNDRSRVQKVYLHLEAPALLHDITTGNSRPVTPETVLEIGKQPIIVTWQGTASPLLSPNRAQ